MESQQVKRDNVKFWMQVVVLPILGLLVASEGWQYYAAPDKIKQDTESHVDNLLVTNMQKKIDSIAFELAKKEFAAKSLEDAVSVIKNKNNIDAHSYLMDVFKVADEAIANDSNWRYVQRPFIDWLYQNKEGIEFVCKNQLLVPYKDKENNKLEFNWIDGHYPITERKVSGGIIRAWRDATDDQHSIQMISSVKDR